jgi:PAS domain-containing protein
MSKKQAPQARTAPLAAPAEADDVQGRELVALRAEVAGLRAQLAALEQPVTDAPAAELFEMSLDNLCVAGLDGYLRRVNPSWTRTLGWTVDELLARPRRGEAVEGLRHDRRGLRGPRRGRDRVHADPARAARSL